MRYTNAFAPGGSIGWNHLDGKDEGKMTTRRNTDGKPHPIRWTAGDWKFVETPTG